MSRVDAAGLAAPLPAPPLPPGPSLPLHMLPSPQEGPHSVLQGLLPFPTSFPLQLVLHWCLRGWGRLRSVLVSPERGRPSTSLSAPVEPLVLGL